MFEAVISMLLGRKETVNVNARAEAYIAAVEKEFYAKKTKVVKPISLNGYKEVYLIATPCENAYRQHKLVAVTDNETFEIIGEKAFHSSNVTRLQRALNA